MTPSEIAANYSKEAITAALLILEKNKGGNSEKNIFIY